jgi:hypothetical protein
MTTQWLNMLLMKFTILWVKNALCMAELLEFLETLKCEFENKGIIKSCSFDDVSIMITDKPINNFDEVVVEGTCYFGKHRHV